MVQHSALAISLKYIKREVKQKQKNIIKKKLKEIFEMTM